MDPSKQQVPRVEGQLSGVEVPSKEVQSEGTKQLNQSLPVEQVGEMPVLNKPIVEAPKVEAQPVRKAVPVENEEQIINNILDQDLGDPAKVTDEMIKIQNK